MTKRTQEHPKSTPEVMRTLVADSLLVKTPVARSCNAAGWHLSGALRELSALVLPDAHPTRMVRMLQVSVEEEQLSRLL